MYERAVGSYRQTTPAEPPCERGCLVACIFANAVGGSAFGTPDAVCSYERQRYMNAARE